MFTIKLDIKSILKLSIYNTPYRSDRNDTSPAAHVNVV